LVQTVFFTQPDEVATSDDDSSEEAIADLHQHEGILTYVITSLGYDQGDRQ